MSRSTLNLEQNQIVAVDQFRFINIAEQAFDFRCRLAGDQTRFAAAVVTQTARDFLAIRADAGDGGAALKFALDRDNADPTLNGNFPRHIPKFAFLARPQVELGKVTFGTVIIGTTSSFAQDSNILKQPGYVLVSPFLQVRPTERVQIGVNAFNVFDKLAIVQLASAAIPTSGLINAQVMNGRTVTGSVRFSF